MASKVFDRAKSMPTDAEEKTNEKTASQLLALRLQQSGKSLTRMGRHASDNHRARLEEPGISLFFVKWDVP